jgi:hypothetical protein
MDKSGSWIRDKHPETARNTAYRNFKFLVSGAANKSGDCPRRLDGKRQQWLHSGQDNHAESLVPESGGLF